ncbi:MAG TPA: PGPGW domain-containing protein [Candidatus Pristimantibacillus sp.]|nr:PGPGW domain-containing protein [Candidatus Pristimantibacillus sp.]
MLKWLHRHWKRTPNHVRKPFVFLLGFTVVGAGIVLLPLPGPGWVIIFAGFAILASEFEFAERVRDRLIEFLKQLIRWSRQLWEKLVERFKNWLQG